MKSKRKTGASIIPIETSIKDPNLVISPIRPEQEQDEGDVKEQTNLMFDQKDISVFKLYCHLSKKTEVFLMILGILGSLCTGVAGPLMSLLMGDVINDFGGTDDNSTKETQSYTTVLNTLQSSIDKMVRKLLYIGVAMFISNFLASFMWSYSGLKQIFNLKKNYFNVILKQEQGWFDKNNAYEFATKVQAQLEQIEIGLGEKLGLIIQSVAQVLAGLIISFITSWNITLIMLTLSPAIFMCILFLMCSMREPMIMSRKKWEEAGGIAEELIYNIKTVTSFANFDFEKKRFNELVDEVHYYNKEKAFKLGISIGGLLFFIFCTFVVAAFYGRRLISHRSWNAMKKRVYQPGDILTVIFSTLQAIMSLGSISPNIKILNESASASSDYFTLYERKVEIDTTQSKMKPKREEIEGKVEFKNISFYYPSDENKKLILNGLNLICPPGKKVALVGESGCGKSTTVNLIERLYDPKEGEVFLDGININKYDINYLRSLIGYVQQEPVLFNTSIKDNLIFGRNELVEKLGDPMELIKEACEEASAKQFIEKNPEQYDYNVGIKGSKLSGGQKQRIAIARAILCKPKILILDEATSALDNKSEKEVQEALDNISKKKVTTIIIAHRLSTIKNADIIYALKNGKVEESGTHEELLKKGGYYANLVKSQITQENFESKEKEEVKQNEIERKKESIRRLVSKRISTRYSNLAKEPEIQLREEEEKKNNKEKINYCELFSLLKNNKLDVFLGSLGALLSGALGPISGFVLSKTINALSSTDMKTLKDDSKFWALMFLVIAGLNFISTFLKMWKLETIGSVISNEMRKKIIEKYMELHIGYFDIEENTPGALLTRLSIDTTSLNSIILTFIGDIFTCTGTLIVGLTLGFYYDWKLTLIGLCFIPFIVISNIFTNKSRRGGRDKDKKIDIEAGSVLSECVINTKTIYSFNFQQPAVDMYIKILERGTTTFLRDSLLRGFLLGIGAFAMYASNATVYHYAAKFIIEGKLKYENMNSCINSVSTMTSGISSGLTGLSDLGKAKKSFQSILKIINIKTEINPFEEANKNLLNVPEDLKGKIEFKNVCFSYPTKPNNLILDHISFEIPAGKSAALVGYSGCGKSTIIQLLERYYDVNSGEILIDDINIKNYNLFQLRKKIGIVSQEPVLFKRSIYDNILYGKLSAMKDEVFTSAKKAKIEKYFNQDSMGMKKDPLSGGEKQRVAIARAFLKDPRILLLDEATSALDKESEIEVQKSINELVKGRTSIAVAHRLSTIVGCDIIFCLESGKIIEKGTHQELLSFNGKYAMLYKFSIGL